MVGAIEEAVHRLVEGALLQCRMAGAVATTAVPLRVIMGSLEVPQKPLVIPLPGFLVLALHRHRHHHRRHHHQNQLEGKNGHLHPLDMANHQRHNLDIKVLRDDVVAQVQFLNLDKILQKILVALLQAKFR